MFFGSATHSEHPARSSRGLFVRDLAASLTAIGALGALLFVIQAKPSFSAKPSGSELSGLKAFPPAASSASATHNRHAGIQARQPSDQAATPEGDEERVAKAMVAFALSKVSPFRPEPITSIPTALTPLSTPLPPQSRRTKAVSRPASPRIPIGSGSVGFAQAEWPVASSRKAIEATPKDQASLAAMSRFFPSPTLIAGGVQSIAGGAKKTVNNGVSGLRNGFSAVQEQALTLAGKLW